MSQSRTLMSCFRPNSTAFPICCRACSPSPPPEWRDRHTANHLCSGKVFLWSSGPVQPVRGEWIVLGLLSGSSRLWCCDTAFAVQSATVLNPVRPPTYSKSPIALSSAATEEWRKANDARPTSSARVRRTDGFSYGRHPAQTVSPECRTSQNA